MSELLSHYELLDPLGKPRFLDDVLAQRPTLLCFLRHFGCLFCFEHAASILERRSQLEACGAQVVFIGNGNPAHAREFMFEQRLEAGVFTDPARRLYRALDLRHGMTLTLNLRSARHMRRAFQQGYRQQGLKGDPWQQGGNVAVNEDGKVLLVQRAEVAGQALPVQQVVDALLKAKRN